MREELGNALDSYLTTGGAYVTAETRTLFKGYYRASAKQEAALVRSFVQFDGEGETANARERDIGGHAAVLLRQIRYRYMPASPYANENGCVPVGTIENYASGRSNGCTSWSWPNADQIVPLMKDPTTIYIYPESEDIKAVAQAVSARQPHASSRPYWNAVCLKQIGAPKVLVERAARTDPREIPQRTGAGTGAAGDVQEVRFCCFSLNLLHARRFAETVIPIRRQRAHGGTSLRRRWKCVRGILYYLNGATPSKRKLQHSFETELVLPARATWSATSRRVLAQEPAPDFARL
jgi:hypothetical protein